MHFLVDDVLQVFEQKPTFLYDGGFQDPANQMTMLTSSTSSTVAYEQSTGFNTNHTNIKTQIESLKPDPDLLSDCQSQNSEQTELYWSNFEEQTTTITQQSQQMNIDDGNMGTWSNGNL